MNYLNEDEKNPFGLSQVSDNGHDDQSYDSCASGDNCQLAGDDGDGGGGGDDD